MAMSESLFIRKSILSMEYWLCIPTLVVQLLVTVAQKKGTLSEQGERPSTNVLKLGKAIHSCIWWLRSRRYEAREDATDFGLL